MELGAALQPPAAALPVPPPWAPSDPSSAPPPFAVPAVAPVGLVQGQQGFYGVVGGNDNLIGTRVEVQHGAPAPLLGQPQQPQYLGYHPSGMPLVPATPSPQPEAPLDERTARHMRGACMNGGGWAICWGAAYFVLVAFTLAAAPSRFILILFTWACTIMMGAGVPVLTWACMGRKYGVSLGMLAEFFWWGGIGGVLCAVIGELFMQVFFVGLGLFPDCNMASKDPDPSFWCQLFIYFQWVLTPGLWEELFKVIWVWLRFKSEARWTSQREDDCIERYRTERVPRLTCCFFDSNVCTCWWRIADTPVAVWMGALAAGGGFESIENIEYMFGDGAGGAFGNVFRASLCMHVLWTGYIGMQLARRQFNAPDERPNLLVTFLPTMFLHGAWDYVASSKVMESWVQIAALVVLLLISIGIVVIPVACRKVLRGVGSRDPLLYGVGVPPHLQPAGQQAGVPGAAPPPFPAQPPQQTRYRAVVPPDLGPGAWLRVGVNGGAEVTVQVPAGVFAGQQFEFVL